MKSLHFFSFVTLLFSAGFLSAQTETHALDSTTTLMIPANQVFLEGYVFEADNRGYLRNALVTIYKLGTHEVYGEGKTDQNGLFQAFLPRDMNFRITAEKKHFFTAIDTITTQIDTTKDKVFTKLILTRKPGYVFDVTVAEANNGKEVTIDAIEGARIEIFNNTTAKEELLLNEYPYPNFKFTFEKGNHYTIMIRKHGYLNKRIEAYINIEGCILCFDGLGIVEPGVTDVLTAGHDIGTFLANIDLEPATLNRTFRLENIYYDYNAYEIREDAAEELKKLVVALKDNPTIIVEMGSHTDARGQSGYNLSLSQKRAKAAMEYLIEVGGISRQRLTWRGYGENQLTNNCGDGVACPENLHQANRRTELKIVGFTIDDPLANMSLKEIIRDERLMREVEESEVVRVSKDN